MDQRFTVECDECGEETRGEAHELVEDGWHFGFVDYDDGSSDSFGLCSEHSNSENLEKHSLNKKIDAKVEASDSQQTLAQAGE